MDLREKEEIALPGGCSPTRSNPACTMLVLDSFSDCVRTNQYTGIPRFTLLMWGHMKKGGKQKPHKLRLLTQGLLNRLTSQLDLGCTTG